MGKPCPAANTLAWQLAVSGIKIEENAKAVLLNSLPAIYNLV